MAKCDPEKTYKLIFFHLEFLRSSTSSDLHLTQLAASIYPWPTELFPLPSLFIPVLPSILPMYMDKHKVCGDLMKTLNMIRKDNGTFLFRSPILVDQSQGEGLACVSEAEALCTFLDILDRAGPNIILVIILILRNCAVSTFPQVGLDEDSVGVLVATHGGGEYSSTQAASTKCKAQDISI